jgi:alpha-L-rhamnosidase
LRSKKKYRLLYLFFVWLFSNALFAQPHIKTNWAANWIGLPTESIPNTFYKYRTNFTLENVPSTVIANISADSKYWLYVNGELAVFEGQLKRGPTPNDTYYDEVDIAKYLKVGDNTICVLLWYWGKDGFSHKSSGKAGLLFEASIGGVKLVSNASWKMQQHMAYQNSTNPHPNFRLPEHNIRYDARLDNEEWIKQNYNDSSWTNASVLAKAGEAPWNKLWLRPIPLWQNEGLTSYKKTQVKNGKTIAMLPKNISITPYFKIEAPAGVLIDIRTDNYYGGGAESVRSEYITKEGVQEFESPAYFTGHWVEYSFPKEVKVLDVKYRETKYNTKHVGNFTSNNAFLNKLWQMSATTLNINMRDGIFDSPERERAQWWGDIVIVLEEIFYTCDSNGKAAVQKAISNLLEWQRKDSVLFSPIPAGNWAKELPAQMLAAISKYSIWKYATHTGDTAILRYAYPFIKKYISLWQLNKNGTVQHREGDWDWHDWGNKVDAPLLDNIWYYMALEGCYNMADFLGLQNDAAAYKQKMANIKNNFDKNFWRGNRFASKGYKFYADDRGNGLAVCAGLVSAKQWKKIEPLLAVTFNAGPYLEKYILESYFIMNNAEAGVQRMKSRYAQMVNHPSITTLWEGWEIGSATYGGGTYNHGWTGGPLSLMSGYMAGIQPTSFGYDSYSIKPQLGGLKNIDCTTATAKGFISVKIQATETKIKMNITTIKANAIVAVPKLQSKSKIISHSKELIFKKEDEQYFYFECYEAGNFEIASGLK